MKKEVKELRAVLRQIYNVTTRYEGRYQRFTSPTTEPLVQIRHIVEDALFNKEDKCCTQ